jgi:glycine betaine/proline transport system permease protein
MDIRNLVDIGGAFDSVIDWLTANVGWFFDGVSAAVGGVLSAVLWVFELPPWYVMLAILVAIAWFVSSTGVAIFTVIGFGLIWYMGLWSMTMSSLALIITSVLIALIIGIPLGIWCSKNEMVWNVVRPILDFMQTLPAFVYLIPSVIFLGLGGVPGVVATLIFSLPPAVRLTNLGIRQVPKEIREAAQSFGSTPGQMLFKAELPVALATIMAGVNQTIMLALSKIGRAHV